MTTVDEPTCEADWLGNMELTVGVVVSGIMSVFGFARVMAFTIVAFVVVEIFAFSTTTFSVLAFIFENPEGIATAGLVVFRHVAVVSKEVVHERLESTIGQGGDCCQEVM